MEADVHDFLEHHGVKGMKWGVRKQKRLMSRAKRVQRRANYNKRVAEINPNPINNRAAVKSQQVADRVMRRAKGQETQADKLQRVANTTFVVGLGVLATGILMSQHGSSRIGDIHVPKARMSDVEAKIRETHAVKLSSLTRMHKEGKMDSAQFKNFSEALNARYERKVAEALRAAKGGG